MSFYRDPPKPKYLFRPQDIVRTATNRRAILTRLRNDGYWDARYISALTGEKTGEETVLQPHTIKPE
jgi:hypothetical protein